MGPTMRRSFQFGDQAREGKGWFSTGLDIQQQGWRLGVIDSDVKKARLGKNKSGVDDQNSLFNLDARAGEHHWSSVFACAAIELLLVMEWGGHRD